MLPALSGATNRESLPPIHPKSGYFELLAYDGIERSVDEAYRAYLDAQLVQFAAENPRDTAGYWKAVRDLRTALLDPGTRSEYPAKMRPAPISAEKAKEVDEARKSHIYELRFLYWFDLRAQFWISKEAAAHDLSKLVKSESIRWIYNEIHSLKERLKTLNARAIAVTQPPSGTSAYPRPVAPSARRNLSDFTSLTLALDRAIEHEKKKSAGRKKADEGKQDETKQGA